MHISANVETVATVGEPEPWFIANGTAMRLLGVRTSTYWRLAREKRILIIGKGRSSRAYYPSLKEYKAALLAEAAAKIGQAA
jgi:hypothetical protein